jgi:hypothetical protein
MKDKARFQAKATIMRQSRKAALTTSEEELQWKTKKLGWPPSAGPG